MMTLVYQAVDLQHIHHDLSAAVEVSESVETEKEFNDNVAIEDNFEDVYALSIQDFPSIKNRVLIVCAIRAHNSFDHISNYLPLDRAPPAHNFS